MCYAKDMARGGYVSSVGRVVEGDAEALVSWLPSRAGRRRRAYPSRWECGRRCGNPPRAVNDGAV